MMARAPPVRAALAAAGVAPGGAGPRLATTVRVPGPIRAGPAATAPGRGPAVREAEALLDTLSFLGRSGPPGNTTAPGRARGWVCLLALAVQAAHAETRLRGAGKSKRAHRGSHGCHSALDRPAVPPGPYRRCDGRGWCSPPDRQGGAGA